MSTHHRIAGTAVLVLLAGAAARAQDAASTLLALVDTSDAIAIADTDATRRGPTGVQTVRFTTVERLRGTVPVSFELSEPGGGELCGRALFGLAPGRYLVFLDTAHTPSPRLAVSGARALVAAHDELVAAVRALLAAPRPRQRAALLVAGLTSADRRVRRDAAIALPRLVGLEQLAGRDRDRLADALRKAVGSGDATLPPLLLAAARLGMADALEPVLRAYLAGHLRPCERLLERELTRFDAEVLVAELACLLPDDRAGQARAARLLDRLPVPAAQPLLVRLLHGGGAAALSAGVILRRDHGATADWIRQQTSPALRDAVEARLAAARRPHYRNVSRGGPR